jgi:hypothetical protein
MIELYDKLANGRGFWVLGSVQVKKELLDKPALAAGLSLLIRQLQNQCSAWGMEQFENTLFLPG